MLSRKRLAVMVAQTMFREEYNEVKSAKDEGGREKRRQILNLSCSFLDVLYAKEMRNSSASKPLQDMINASPLNPEYKQ